MNADAWEIYAAAAAIENDTRAAAITHAIRNFSNT